MNRPIEILLVEDNPADAHLAKVALLAGNISKKISVVTDGVQAIDYLRRRGRFAEATKPDLVLLDLNLPRRGGLEVLREIKSDPQLRSITVIVLSTSSYESDVNTAYELLANCYVVKPVDLDQFYSVMQAIEDFWMSISTFPTESENPKKDASASKDQDKEEGAAPAGGCAQVRSRLLRTRKTPARRRLKVARRAGGRR